MRCHLIKQHASAADFLLWAPENEVQRAGWRRITEQPAAIFNQCGAVFRPKPPGFPALEHRCLNHACPLHELRLEIETKQANGKLKFAQCQDSSHVLRASQQSIHDVQRLATRNREQKHSEQKRKTVLRRGQRVNGRRRDVRSKSEEGPSRSQPRAAIGGGRLVDARAGG